MEKTVKVNWEGAEVEVTQRQLLWEDVKKARGESIVIRKHEGKLNQFRDTDTLEDLRIVASIVSSPFPATVEGLGKLSEADRYKLAFNLLRLEEGDKAADDKSS